MVNLLQLTESIALRPDRHLPLKPSLRACSLISPIHDVVIGICCKRVPMDLLG
jgi:hypothetical protein